MAEELMEDSVEMARFEIGKLELAVGDVLVVRTNNTYVPEEQATFIRDLLRSVLPSTTQVVVVPSGFEFAVIRPPSEGV